MLWLWFYSKCPASIEKQKYDPRACGLFTPSLTLSVSDFLLITPAPF